MPRARRRRLGRRRRGRRPARQSVGTVVVLIVVVAVVGVLVVGSIVEINAQSGPYRAMTDHGYGAVASRVIDASNQTGKQLATVISQAPTLPNGQLPYKARGQIQQGLDQAVSSATEEVRQITALVPPVPIGTVAQRLTAVFDQRATAVTDLRATIDAQLGMAPLPIAGAPSTVTTAPAVATASIVTTAPAVTSPTIPIGQASSEATRAGGLIEQADRAYASLAAELRRGGSAGSGHIRLPPSVWAPSTTAALGATGLAGLPARLGASAALVPFHDLVITAVGLTPPAVPVAGGSSGIVSDGCGQPSSSAPTGSPAVLPPTGSVSAQVTLTNCGTVTEPDRTVTEDLALADPAGRAPPRAAASGSSAHVAVTVASGSSTSVSLPALRVARGHNYTLTITVAVSARQRTYNSAGTSQGFLLQISS